MPQSILPHQFPPFPGAPGTGPKALMNQWMVRTGRKIAHPPAHPCRPQIEKAMGLCPLAAINPNIPGAGSAPLPETTRDCRLEMIPSLDKPSQPCNYGNNKAIHGRRKTNGQIAYHPPPHI